MSTSIPLSGQHHEGDHPELENHAPEPKGVIRRNLKMQVYLGIAVLFIIATAISSLRHKPVAKQQGQPPAPMVQDSNANIEEMKRSLEAQQRQAAGPRLGNPAPEMATPSQPGVQPYGAGRNAVRIPLCAWTALCASGARRLLRLPAATHASTARADADRAAGARIGLQVSLRL